MAKIFMQKHLGALRPADAKAEEALARIKAGADIEVEIRRPRNIKMHRLFWALMHLVYDNQDRYESVEHLVVAFKVALGHCDTVICKDGNPAYIPKSISFAKMPQDEFEAFFTRCIDIVVKHFLPGVTEADVRRELEEMTGINRRAA